MVVRIRNWFGDPLPTLLPTVSLTGDNSESFRRLLQNLSGVPVVLFPDIVLARLDGFFHLRLAQLLAKQGPLPALSVVVLAADPAGSWSRLGGRFADRFRASWPFERCIFVTHGAAPTVDLGARLGLPVARIDDDLPVPEVLWSAASAEQPIALQIQSMWRRCGSTTAFENQTEQLVQAGFLTIRAYRDGSARRGPTLDRLMERVNAENNEHAGAHVDVAAVPHGPPSPGLQFGPVPAWATLLAEEAACRIDDRAVAQAAESADVAIANHIHSVGLALHLAPRARLLLDTHDDQADVRRQARLLRGGSQTEAEEDAAVADAVQKSVFSTVDFCTFVNQDELQRLGPSSRRAALVLPRIYLGSAKAALPERFDIILVGDQHRFNVLGLQWFLDEIWLPHLQPAGLRAAIVGRVGQVLAASAYPSSQLYIAGFIDDLDTFRSCCRLTVVPDRGGSGLPVKMLTTLAAGHPVCTTTLGLRGLPASIAGLIPAFDDGAEMAADILGLLADPERLQERRGRVRRAYQALQLGPRYIDCLDSIVPPARAERDRRAAHWSDLISAAVPPDTTPYYFRIGAEFFLLSGTPWDCQVVVEGWHAPESWGRWTDGADGCLRLVLPEPLDEPVGLELDIEPSPAGAWLTITLDDTAIATLAPLPGLSVVELPADCMAGKTSFMLRLHVDETACPADRSNLADERILGIGLRRIRLISRRPTQLQPGQLVRLYNSAIPWDLLLTGWHALEDWGCWTSGVKASLQLRFAEPLQGRLELELDLVPSPVGASLTLTVNDCALPPTAPVNGINRWELDTSLTQAQTHLLLGIVVSATVCPAATGDSTDDRILGVGLRSVRLAARDPAICAVGEVVSLGQAEVPERVLSDGWHRPEAWGCWTSGAVATLSLRLAEPLHGSFRFDLDIARSPVATTLRLVVNGEALPVVVPQPGRNSWTLPGHCTQGHARLSVELHVSETFCPAELSGSKDDRVLGIGVHAFGLHRVAQSRCEIDTTIPLTKGSDVRGILQAGWHNLEEWGCWSSGPDASLFLEFDEALDGEFMLELNLAPPLLEQPTTVIANGTVLETLSVLNGINLWALPLGCTAGQTTLQVRLLVDHAVRPIDVGESADARKLGLGVRSVCLHRLAHL